MNQPKDLGPAALLGEFKALAALHQPSAEPGELLLIRPGKPLFTKDDLIGRHLNAHDKILRVACIRNSITEEYFTECFNRYALEVLNEMPTKIYHQKLNLLRAIRSGGITTKRFNDALCSVLRGQINEVAYTVSFPGCKPQIYRMSEIARMIPIQQQPNHGAR